MKKLYPLLLPIVLLSSCVSLFSRKEQPVMVTTATEGATIYYQDKAQGKNTAALKWNKADKVQQVVVKKEGYLDKTFAQVVTKKNPLRYANIISIVTII